MSSVDHREPVPGVAHRPDLFNRRTRVVLGVTLPVLLGVTLVAMLTAPTGTMGTRHGSNSYSVSAVGFHGLVELFEELGLTVLSSRHASAQRCDESTPLVLLEPPLASSSGASMSALVDQAEARSAAVIVVLPKWSSRPAKRNSAWSGEVWAVPSERPREVVSELVGRDVGAGGIIRLNRPLDAGWMSAAGTDGQARLPYPQLLSERIRELEPLVWHPAGIVAARIADRSIIVISDPDLVNNVGLRSADNAIIAHGLLLGSPPARALVIDETLHDFTAAPSIWRGLFRFPLSLVTIHAAIGFAAVIWVGAGRFGRAEPAPPSYRPGSATLIDATTRLLAIADRPWDALNRYWRIVLDRTIVDILPGGARSRTRPSAAELISRMDAIGKRRGVSIDLESLASEVDQVTRRGADGHELVETAHSIHRWRREILDGPRSDR